MRQKNVWHLKFKDSEIYMWCHILEFNSFGGFDELKKVKRTGWILPSGRKLPYRHLEISLFELQSPPWFRSADLGFGRFAGSGSNSGCFASLCSNLWSGIFELRSDLECLFRVGFRVEVMFCSCAGYFQFWIFVGSWILMKPDAVPSAFREKSEQTSWKIKDFI